MTGQEREKFLSVLSKQITKNGEVKLRNLHIVLPEAGLDRTVYNKKGPKVWLTENFKEFAIVGNNGYEAIRFAEDPIVKAWKTINRSVEMEGGVLLSDIPPLLVKQGVDYKKLAGGKSLKEWVLETFPEFTIPEDGSQRLYKKGASPAIPAPVVPEEDVQSPEVQQMHRMAFMDWWSGNVRKLRAYNEELNSESEVRSSIARQLASMMLGASDGVIDARKEEPPRVAFDSGLKSSEGKTIYCIMVPNLKDGGTKQKWKLSGFSCVSDHTPESEWLQKHIQVASGTSVTFSMLEEKALEVREAMQMLLPQMQEYMETLREGRLPEYTIADQAGIFEKQMEELRQAYREIWNKDYPNDLTLEQIAAQNSETQSVQYKMQHALEVFQRITAETVELFEGAHLQKLLSEQEKYTPEADWENIHQKYESIALNEDFALFEEIVHAYEVLLKVMAASEYTDEILGEIKHVLCAHFQEITERFAISYLMNYPKAGREFLEEISIVKKEIADCKKQLLQFGSRSEERECISSSELLENCLQEKRDGMVLASYATAIYPENEDEQALVLPASERNAALSGALTYHAAAMRLYDAIGNKDQLAEKYLILGLATDAKQCVPALLKIYREEKREAEFAKIMELFPGEEETSATDRMYYLEIMCQSRPESVWEYIQKNSYLLYQEECIKALLALPEEALPERERQILSGRLKSYSVYQQANELESALLDGAMEKVRELASQRERLTQMGYSAEMVQRIAEAAQKEVVVGDGQLQDYGKGLRLYRFQGNIHGLAERYMWKGIAQDQTLIAKHLMVLLAEEERWEECCRLYECFRKSYSGNVVCRQYYLMALFRMDSADTRDYVRENLQECLTTIASQNNTVAYETLIEMAESGKQEQREFYGCICQIVEAMTVPIVKSIVLMEWTLREYATSASAREAGLSSEYADSIKNVYQSDSYPHGSDAVSVAERAYCFFGAYRSVAECAAKLALPDAGAVELLWKIYDKLEREDLQYGLMQRYPILQKTHEELYEELLFEKGAYEEFLSVCDEADCDWGRKLQCFIAELKTDPSSSIRMPEVTTQDVQAETDWYERWGILLMETLFVTDRMEDVKAVLCAGFVKWVVAYTQNVLKELVTGAGAAAEDALQAVQEYALQANCLELALYIYNVLQIGDLKAESEEFLEACTQEEQAAGSGTKLETLQKLRVIFGDASGDVNAKIALIHIEQIKEQTGLLEQTEEELAVMLEGFPAGGQFMESLCSLLDQTAVCRTSAICRKLLALPKTAEDRKSLLKFLNKQPWTTTDIDFMRCVCILNQEMLENGEFPVEAWDDAQSLVTAYVESCKTAEGMLCLYEIEEAMGASDRADYLLRVLADQPKDDMEDGSGEKIERLVETRWATKIPAYFELFKSVLKDRTVEEIEQYISFAHVAASAEWNELALASADSGIQDGQMLSEKDSNAVIKQLYLTPTRSDVWKRCRHLPIQDDPVGYAKLLLLACMNHAGGWENCANYCEKYEQNDLLLDLLVIWAKSIYSTDVEKCRKYLENRLMSQPDYFVQWKGKKELREISGCICAAVKQSVGEPYASICAVSLIAEKTGSPEALEELMDVFNEALFGIGCNIGVVLAANLLMDARFEEAQKVLGRLKNVLMNMNYRALVDELAEKTVDELKVWRQDTKNVIMLQLIPMDGNRPSLQRINEMTCREIKRGRAKETAEVIQDMLRMFPNDYGAYNALYHLSCTQFDGFLSVLHKSLRGLIACQPADAAKSYYRRDQMQYARMLAALDAVIFANGEKELININYELDPSTQMYRWNLKNVPLSVDQIQDARDEEKRIRDSFENHEPEEQQLLTEAYISCITGNWRTLIRRVNNGIMSPVMRDVMKCTLHASVEDIGFARSVFVVLLELPKEDRMALVERLEKLLSGHSMTKGITRRQEQIHFVKKFVGEGCFERLEEQTDPEPIDRLLESNFEDYSCFTYWQEQYVETALAKNVDHLFELSLLVGGLICQDGFWNEVLKQADRLFDQGNDRQACSLYHSADEFYHSFRIIHTVVSLRRQYTWRRELTEARYRITALFSGDKKMKETVGSPDFHVWSAVNLVLTLLGSKRCNEVLRLASFLSEQNARLAQALLRGVDLSVSPWEKWQALDQLSDDAAKLFYCYVLKHPYNRTPNNSIEISYALGNSEEAKEIAARFNQRYLELAKRLQEHKHPAMRDGSLSPGHYLLLLGNGAVDQKLLALQKDPMQWVVSEEADEAHRLINLDELPFYAKDLEALQGEESAKEILQRRSVMQNTKEQIEEKEALSQKLCQYCLGDGNGSFGTLRDALLLYGTDHYYHAYAMEDQEEANQTLFALTDILKNVPAGDESDASGDEVKELIRQVGVRELLFSADSLKQLLESYIGHRQLYHFMQNILNDSLLRNCVGQIYAVLDNLKNSYYPVVSENYETLRAELSENYMRLERIETNRWMDLKNKVQKLINDEINELDQRPVLQIKILNEGVQKHVDYLYGQVVNVGQIAAEYVVLQANYSGNGSSYQYELKRLLPGACAVFEIDYRAPEGLSTLEYFVNVSFAYGDKTHDALACKGQLQLGEVELTDDPTGILNAKSSGMDFKVDEKTGEVYNPNFVGRKTEMTRMRRLVEGTDFCDYKSILVYGIKRTGKTSLLDYLAAYIRANRKKIICVRVSCQDMSPSDEIHNVFVTSVFEHLMKLPENQERLPELTDENPKWVAFQKEWNEYYCADLNPEKLGLFYRSLAAFLGEYGLYLIIDEIDRLFYRVSERTAVDGDQKQCTLDALFGAISAILDSAECRKIVHFVVCGSNWLIRYNLKGDLTNQLFQRFDEKPMIVGQLPEADAKAAVCVPYSNHPEVKFTNEALDWIWNDAGGLVWHTKLLANEALERAYEDDRCVVYPSDIYESLPKILVPNYCKQFSDACGAEGDQLIDAMQSLAAKKDSYVPVSRIGSLLLWEHEKLQKELQLLAALKIVEQHPTNPQYYRFELDIYRRYFRSVNCADYPQVPEDAEIFRRIYQTPVGNHDPNGAADDWDIFA